MNVGYTACSFIIPVFHMLPTVLFVVSLVYMHATRSKHTIETNVRHIFTMTLVLTDVLESLSAIFFCEVLISLRGYRLDLSECEVDDSGLCVFNKKINLFSNSIEYLASSFLSIFSYVSFNTLIYMMNVYKYQFGNERCAGLFSILRLLLVTTLNLIYSIDPAGFYFWLNVIPPSFILSITVLLRIYYAPDITFHVAVIMLGEISMLSLHLFLVVRNYMESDISDSYVLCLLCIYALYLGVTQMRCSKKNIAYICNRNILLDDTLLQWYQRSLLTSDYFTVELVYQAINRSHNKSQTQFKIFPEQYIECLYGIKSNIKHISNFESLYQIMEPISRKGSIHDQLLLSRFIVQFCGNIYYPLVLINKIANKNANCFSLCKCESLINSINFKVHDIIKASEHTNNDTSKYQESINIDKTFQHCISAISDIRAIINIASLQLIDIGKLNTRIASFHQLHHKILQRSSNPYIIAYLNVIKQPLRLPSELDVLDSVPSIIICSTSDKYRIKYASTQSRQLLEYTLEELIDMPIIDVMPPIYAALHDTIISQFMERPYGKELSKKSCYLLKKSGFIVPIELTINILPYIWDNSLYAMLTIKRNINLQDNAPTVLLNMNNAICACSYDGMNLLKLQINDINSNSIKLSSLLDITIRNGISSLNAKLGDYLLRVTPLFIKNNQIGYEASIIPKSILLHVTHLKSKGSSIQTSDFPKKIVIIRKNYNKKKQTHAGKEKFAKFCAMSGICIIITYIMFSIYAENKNKSSLIRKYDVSMGTIVATNSILFLVNNQSSIDWACKILDNQYDLEGLNTVELYDCKIVFSYVGYLCSSIQYSVEKHYDSLINYVESVFMDLIYCESCDSILGNPSLLLTIIVACILISLMLIALMVFNIISIHAHLGRFRSSIIQIISKLSPGEKKYSFPSNGRNYISLVLLYSCVISLGFAIIPIYRDFQAIDSSNIETLFNVYNTTLLYQGLILYHSHKNISSLLLESNAKQFQNAQTSTLADYKQWYNKLYTDGAIYSSNCASQWSNIGFKYMISQLIYNSINNVSDDCLLEVFMTDITNVSVSNSIKSESDMQSQEYLKIMVALLMCLILIVAGMLLMIEKCIVNKTTTLASTTCWLMDIWNILY